jgi:membrane protein YdbS with pleckstrin-like domain
MKNFLSLFTTTLHSFEGQEPGEKIVLFLRRHPFVIVIRIVGVLVAYMFIAGVILAFGDYVVAYNLQIPLLFLLSLFTLIVWCHIFYAFTMYTLDVWIVTDRRVIDSNQHSFFNRTVAELRLSKIQDIYIDTKGPIQTFLNFGNLFIQTAGTEERFKFLQIPNPVAVKDAIMEVSQKKEGDKLV